MVISSLVVIVDACQDLKGDLLIYEGKMKFLLIPTFVFFLQGFVGGLLEIIESDHI